MDFDFKKIKILTLSIGIEITLNSISELLDQMVHLYINMRMVCLNGGREGVTLL